MRANVIDGEAPPPDYNIKLEGIVLYVQIVMPSDMCFLAIIDTLKIAPVKYPIRHVEMRLFSVPAGVSS